MPKADAVRAVRTGAFATLAVLAGGALAIPVVNRMDLKFVSLFYEQFAEMEAPAFAVVALFAGVVLFALWRSRQAGDVPPAAPARSRLMPAAVCMALATVAVCAIGFVVVFHRYYQADDEFSAWFQAHIFAHGDRVATVPTDWCRWMPAAMPTSIRAGGACHWELSFLPIHSMVRSVFLRLNADMFAAPVTAAISIILLASIARRVWPDKPVRTWAALLAFATSGQLLFMSMTMWSMPTHLLVALIWLRLYVEDRPWSVVLLPLVGFVALGVHSPIPHGLWVVPFLLRYWRDKRWGWATYTTLGYAVVVAYWAHEMGYGAGAALPSATPGTLSTIGNASIAAAGAVRAPFRMPGELHGLTTAMHISLIAAWSAPLTMILMVTAMAAWRRLDSFTRDCALGVLVIIAARFFVVTPQGEGWGYRFIYNALGNIAIVAGVGAEILAVAIGRQAMRRLVAAQCAVAILILVPLRGIQIERQIAPNARAVAWMQQLPADVVVFPWERVAWGRQMLRNDPYLRNRPVMVGQVELGDTGLAQLQARFPGRVRVVTAAELARFGLERRLPSLHGFQLVE
jgi:hypothetical protein